VFCHTTHIMVEFLRGRVALADLAPRARQYDAEAVRLKQQNGRGYFMPVAQLILNLSGSSDRPQELRGDIFDYERDIPDFITQNNVIAVFHSHIVRSFTALLFGDYVLAESEAEHASKYLEANPAGQYLIVLAFSHAMSSLALAGSGAPSERGRRLRTASRIIKQMKKWADFNDDNYGAFYRIAIAERERVQGSDSRAIHLFDEAITHARDKGFLNLEAFANELVGKFHMQRGSEKSARPYIADARYAYMRWGAAAKVRDIDARFEEMVRKIVAAEKLASQTRGDTLTRTASMTSTASAETTGSSFDINTVTKAVQALSGEIFLDKLLRKMMEILIQNAGAEKAILMLEKDGKFYIEAEASTQNNQPSILQSVPVDSDALAPLAIVEYVRRTNEAVVLGNAAQEGLFTRSPYVQEHKTKSVICSPITQRGKLFGMIYLENNLATNAFTGGRIEILRILTTQAAISLENARLVAEETERQKLQKEMEMAKQVQMSILPRFVEDEAYRITAHMTPADQVGGDYYDFYNINGKRWIAIGDVTGHGMNSGLMMLMAQTGFSTYLNSTSNPDILEGFSAINKTLHMNMMDRTKQELYMTFTALSADNDGHFEHVGKHEDILVYRKSTGKVETVKSDGFWMGLVPDVKPMLAKAAFSLNSGDFITLFTDGVIEGRNATGEQFDTHRLISTIEAFAAEGIGRVKDEIVNACFQWMDKQDDDLTLFIMQKK
jgi:serine phosphatase RsbU (regulator of sigma subunit)